nr:glycosyltransferase [Actinomycetota bacterium]
MKTVLFISYFYPPFDSTAAVEASQLSRHLVEFGWEPLVLAGFNDLNPSLPVQVPEELVYRTAEFDINALPKRILSRRNHVGHAADGSTRLGGMTRRLEQAYRQILHFPDAHIGWLPYARREGRRLIKLRQPDLIFSMGGPFTSHLVARSLAVEGDIPWIADFRDLWTDNHYFQRARPLNRLERRMEAWALAPASALTTPTPAWAAVLRQKFGKATSVVPNGFELSELERVFQHTRPRDGKKFVLAYTGVYYRGYQDADALLDAIALLKRRGLIDSVSFELRLVGRYCRALRPAVARRDLQDLVVMEDAVSHHDALREQARATAVVFFLWQSPRGRG